MLCNHTHVTRKTRSNQCQPVPKDRTPGYASPLPIPIPSFCPHPFLSYPPTSKHAPSSYADAACNNFICCSGCVLSTLLFATFFNMKFASISTSSTSSLPLTRHFPLIVSMPTGGLAFTREFTPQGTLVSVSVYDV